MILEGINASQGIAICKAFKLENLDLEYEKKIHVNIDKEKDRFIEAINHAKEELMKLKDETSKKLGSEKAMIFGAHLLVLNDPELVNMVNKKIEEEAVNVEAAYMDVVNMYITTFENMSNKYMKERATDIKDVSKRVMAILLNKKINFLCDIKEEVIIVANDLTPSDTTQLDKKYIKGFVTNIGGRTSHSAIMARSMEIPAVVGTKDITNNVETGDILILDAVKGIVIINPNASEINDYKELIKKYQEEKEQLKKLKNKDSVSKDGFKTKIMANIGTPEDVLSVLANGAEGIGLYRTEFLYMDRDSLPTEREQFEAYKIVLEKMEDNPVVIRTLDVGGDKQLNYLNIPNEMNPFLGYRAIRLCLDKKDIFKVQLRALLRASTYGHLKIMFPMISTIDEFLAAKSFLLEVKSELIEEGYKVSDEIEIGIMVEVPATAILAEQFAKHVDFFSIGTNDLMQYTFAADRLNENVSYLYQPLNPSILKLIKMTIDAGNKANIWTGMCGEMAGDERVIPILLGLGLHEFSMSSTSILNTKQIISKLNKKDMEKIALKAIKCDNQDEVKNLIQQGGK